MPISRRSIAASVVLILPWLTGCAADSALREASLAPAQAVERPPVPATAPSAGATKNPYGVIRLRDALTLALLQNPALSTSAYDIRAAEALTIQAALIPNPEIGADIEDFGGTGQRGGFNSAQSTLSLGQLVELGSKRMRRVQLARLDEALAGWDFEVKRLDVLVGTVRAFVGVLAAQRKRELARSLLDLDQQIYGTVAERLKAGQVAPLEEQRAQVAVANSRINLERAESELQAARQRLSAMWGEMQPRFASAGGNLSDAGPIMPLPRLLALAEDNPDLARWSAEIAQRHAKLAVERARGIPDPRVVGGVRRYNDRSETAFVAGVAVPIPVFGLNTGNIRQAEILLERGKEQRRAVRLSVTLAISQAYQQVSAAYAEISGLNKDVLPAAEAAAEAARTGYQAGRFGLLQVIDARRALAEARTRLIDAYASYHAALADAERLTGHPLRRLGRR